MIRRHDSVVYRHELLCLRMDHNSTLNETCLGTVNPMMQLRRNRKKLEFRGPLIIRLRQSGSWDLEIQVQH